MAMFGNNRKLFDIWPIVFLLVYYGSLVSPSTTLSFQEQSTTLCVFSQTCIVILSTCTYIHTLVVLDTCTIPSKSLFVITLATPYQYYGVAMVITKDFCWV